MEAIAILEALRYCLQQDIRQIWLETDSMMMKNVIIGIWKPPWVIEDEIEEIKKLLIMCNGEITHIYREGNKLADHLANYALDVGNIVCHDFHQLDTHGRRLVNVDKLLCPNLRIKAARY